VPKIIALLGRAQNGKSTAAAYLSEKYNAREFFFASPLKKAAQEIWGFSQEQMFGPQEVKEAIDERWNMSPRTAMQNLGGAMRNQLGKDVWIRACLASISRDFHDRPGCPFYVISDVRHVNEVLALSDESDSYIIKLEKSDAPLASNATHPSEAEVDMVPADLIDVTIRHSSRVGLADLYAQLDQAVLGTRWV
jgi:hypothetical protein